MNKPKYEYKREFWDPKPNGWPNPEDREEFINRIAADGWRLVSTMISEHGYFFAWFERQIDE